MTVENAQVLVVHRRTRVAVEYRGSVFWRHSKELSESVS